MNNSESIGNSDRSGRSKKGRGGLPPGAGFASGKLDARAASAKANAARWSKDRRTISELCKQLTPKALGTLVDVIINTKAKDADRIRASEIVLSYGHGKPRQQLDLEVRRGADINELSRDALMLALTRAAEREGIALPVVIEGKPISDRCVLHANKGGEVEVE